MGLGPMVCLDCMRVFRYNGSLNEDSCDGCGKTECDTHLWYLTIEQMEQIDVVEQAPPGEGWADIQKRYEKGMKDLKDNGFL